MKKHRIVLTITLIVFGVSLLSTVLLDRNAARVHGWPKDCPLPQPSSMDNAAFEAKLYPFLQNREYADLPGWAVDKRIRDCGPYIDSVSYGVHPAVRIYYSPNFYQWLKGGRKGPAPQGSIIVKEMFETPSARWLDYTDEQLADTLHMWTAMVRDMDGSWDGWYWGAYNTGEEIDDPERYYVDNVDGQKVPYGYHVPNSGFATYCIRCHASAEDNMTFSSLDNIKGEPGDPLIYKVDNSWRTNDGLPKAIPAQGEHNFLQAEFDYYGRPTMRRLARRRMGSDVNSNYEAFTAFFNMRSPVSPDSVVNIPPKPYDHVVSTPNGPMQFATSDNCLGCHSASSSNYSASVNMWMPDTDPPMNLSPYGEWNGSMMGLAGRDPIFYAQLESEMALHPQDTLPDMLQNTCLSCHGVMGQRQFHVDKQGKWFREAMMYDKGNEQYAKYGALGRDGISCMVCHQIVDDDKPLIEIATGKFSVSEPGEFGKEDGKDISYIWGPYEDVATHPMLDGLGMRPKYSGYIKESRLCGSCHTVYLPVFQADGKPAPDKKDPKKQAHFFEQTTYIEWENSAYQNEFKPWGNDVKTCQSCHMPTTFPYGEDGAKLNTFMVANTQDQSYPQAEHLAPYDSLFVRTRDTFHRHTLLGINQFGMEMFNQFDSILGNYKTDYMTKSQNLPLALQSAQNLTVNHTAEVSLSDVEVKGGKVAATVNIHSLVGHRFPSGVGFRRAFLEFVVRDASGKVIWGSGQTNKVGVIVDGEGKPLPSEFFAKNSKGEQMYEPHYQKITKENQAQIYQELVKNYEGEFTTSFIALYTVIKDNRFLPDGWTWDGPKGMPEFYVEHTRPHGKAVKDKNFGAGGDAITYVATLPQGVRPASIEANLYYQAIPPFYLKDRFEQARGKDGQRLYFLASNLNLNGTNIQDWKLKVAGAKRRLK